MYDGLVGDLACIRVRSTIARGTVGKDSMEAVVKVLGQLWVGMTVTWGRHGE